MPPVFLAVLMVGCMYLPAPRNDFSVMGKDEISVFISNGETKVISPRQGVFGPSRLDGKLLASQANDFYKNFSPQEVKARFLANGDSCGEAIKFVVECRALRSWRIKNIGAQGSELSTVPVAEVLFVFVFDEHMRLSHVGVSVVDLTKY